MGFLNQAKWVWQCAFLLPIGILGLTLFSNTDQPQEKFNFAHYDHTLWEGKIRAFTGKYNPRFTGIVIEGDIEEGDYERFREVVRGVGPDLSTVYLLSRGGNAYEAMKIGRLIRDLHYNTAAWAMNVNGERKCHFDDPDPVNCTCESACFLIFVGGIDRHANMLGIHRVYIDHQYLKTLSGKEAMSYSKKLKEEVSRYLNDMSTPSSIIERVFNIPSNEMVYLSPEELNSFTGEIDDIQEWVSSRCERLDVKQAREYLIQRGFKMSLFNGTSDSDLIKHAESSCRSHVLENLAVTGWERVFNVKFEWPY
jgi:hypothetical protein